MTTSGMPGNRGTPEKPSARLPALGRTWVQYVIGFGVSVAVGLAPYLGRVRVPLFTPMLSLLPDSLQDIALPVSSMAMGIVAVLVQWYGNRRLSKKWLEKSFGRTALVTAAALFAITAIELIAVVRVEVPATESTVSFAVGAQYPDKPPCSGISRSQCISTVLSLDESRIESFFGEGQSDITKLVLVIVYTTLMSSFGAMIGLLLLSAK
jgi:hypothetical protein